MRNFRKSEIKAVGTILFIVIVISLQNFKIAIRRGRDQDRKISLGEVHTALNYYQNDFGFYPPSKDGKIVACVNPDIDYKGVSLSISKKTTKERLLELFAPCDWGKDGLSDISDTTYPSYLKTLPNDPDSDKGVKFYYVSDINNFQLYGALESSGEDEYDLNIQKREFMCGTRICNFGKAPGRVPLDKTLEEYENERVLNNE